MDVIPNECILWQSIYTYAQRHPWRFKPCGKQMWA
jgi:hypothetical protein